MNITKKSNVQKYSVGGNLVKIGKYVINPLNPEHINLVKAHWLNKYPNTFKFLHNQPKKVMLGIIDQERPYLEMGQLPLSKEGQALAKVMESRMSKYPIKKNLQDKAIVFPGMFTTKGIPEMMKQITDRKTSIYIPLKNEGSINGFSDGINSALLMNPWRSKSIQFSQFHEGVSHATDPFVKDYLVTSYKGQETPILGKVFGLSDRLKHADGVYGKISMPEDIYGAEILNKVLHSDSMKPIEARSTNWEMIMDLYQQLAKNKGVNFKQATELPPEEFNKFVDTTLNNTDNLKQFMRKFDNQYLSDYAEVLESGTQEQANQYAKRIKNAIKYLPMVGLSAYLANNKSNNIT